MTGPTEPDDARQQRIRASAARIRAVWAARGITVDDPGEDDMSPGAEHSGYQLAHPSATRVP
jgi:hypothetical protein